MSAAAVQIENLHFSFGERAVLRGLSFTLAQGEFVTLVGLNGSGKSVLLSLIAGLRAPESGTVRANPVSLALQRAPLFPWLTLGENLKICMNDGLARREKEELVDSLLRLAQLTHARDFYPGQCSGGMQQKVNVLRCFCNDHPIVLMDEPFVFLDHLQKTELQDFTARLCRERGKTVLFVTHDLDEAIFLSDRILVLARGRGTLVRELPVPLPHPRVYDEIRKTPLYHQAFAELMALLRADLDATRTA